MATIVAPNHYFRIIDQCNSRQLMQKTNHQTLQQLHWNLHYKSGAETTHQQIYATTNPRPLNVLTPGWPGWTSRSKKHFDIILHLQCMGENDYTERIYTDVDKLMMRAAGKENSWIHQHTSADFKSVKVAKNLFVLHQVFCLETCKWNSSYHANCKWDSGLIKAQSIGLRPCFPKQEGHF